MPDPKDLVPVLFDAALSGINDVVDGGQDLFDTITDFVSGNDDNDLQSELEHVIKRNVTLTDDEIDSAIAWTKPLMADLGHATVPRYPRGHAKAGEIMPIKGVKFVLDQTAPLGVRVNMFSREVTPRTVREAYKKGFEDGVKSRTRRRRVSV